MTLMREFQNPNITQCHLIYTISSIQMNNEEKTFFVFLYPVVLICSFNTLLH